MIDNHILFRGSFPDRKPWDCVESYIGSRRSPVNKLEAPWTLNLREVLSCSPKATLFLSAGLSLENSEAEVGSSPRILESQSGLLSNIFPWRIIHAARELHKFFELFVCTVGEITIVFFADKFDVSLVRSEFPNFTVFWMSINASSLDVLCTCATIDVQRAIKQDIHMMLNYHLLSHEMLRHPLLWLPFGFSSFGAFVEPPFPWRLPDPCQSWLKLASVAQVKHRQKVPGQHLLICCSCYIDVYHYIILLIKFIVFCNIAFEFEYCISLPLVYLWFSTIGSKLQLLLPSIRYYLCYLSRACGSLHL